MPARIRFSQPHNSDQLFQELRNAGVPCKIDDYTTIANTFWVYTENQAQYEATIRSVVADHVPAAASGTGSIGPTGATGPQGPKGDKGDKGDQGEQGLPGQDGADGADGATGPAGGDGANGSAGAAGSTGAQGPQ